MNTDNAKVVAVVLTYNRKKLVEECLRAILRQTHPVDKIFLVDNASTDGTQEMVKEKFSNNDIISFIRLEENEGPAGGYHEGVKRAYEYGTDWIWMMDDDVEPVENALEVKLAYGHISECIHAERIYSDGSVPALSGEGFFDCTTGVSFLYATNISFEHGKDFYFTNKGNFEGMLISSRVVGKIGYPDKRFFHSHVDLIYGFLANTWTNVICIKNIGFIRKIGSLSTPMPFSDSSLYYANRNRFLVAQYLREMKFLNEKRWRIITVGLTIKGIYQRIFIEKSFRRLVIFIKATNDGINSRWGKRTI